MNKKQLKEDIVFLEELKQALDDVRKGKVYPYKFSS
jgi:hypothetical protein